MEIFLLLGVFLLFVCAFEFINGFHDTANAVAPVIYTNSLSPKKSVLLAAFFNFLGVTLGGISVAMGIIHLLPLDMIASEPVSFGITVVLSLLVSAIIWNFGTWYLGIPASSSHTLIGSILGVSIAMYILDSSVSLPVSKVIEVMKSLLFSPVIGFILAFGAMHAIHLITKNKTFFEHPGRFWNKYPKTWIKTTLIGSSAFVSFAHGSNDGQKGVGLAMLILISLLPASFAINTNLDFTQIGTHATHLEQTSTSLAQTTVSKDEKHHLEMIANEAKAIKEAATKKDTLTSKEKIALRKNVLAIEKESKSLGELNTNSAHLIQEDIDIISPITDYAPWWIIAMISLSLGLGTMVGWKRIVITIGEKIGKDKLTYAQATVASLMTAITISSASRLGLPVSTTHILSSGVAGTMAHEHGKHGLQGDTIKSILLAWVLTLPVSTLLAGGLFFVFRFLFVR